MVSPPIKDTPEYDFLKEYCSRVEIILHTVNNNEHAAALTKMDPPSEIFAFVVENFPEVGMFVGKFAEKEVVLIKTKPGRQCKDKVKEAINKFTTAKYIIAAGVCYAFGSKEQMLGDIIVSKHITTFRNSRRERDTINNRDGPTYTVKGFLSDTFCTTNDLLTLNFKVATNGRNAKVHCKTFISSDVLVDDKKERDRLYHAVPSAIAGEMEGDELIDIIDTYNKDFKRELKMIIIKGVADYADGKKNKEWQYTAAMAAFSYTEENLKRVHLPGKYNYHDCLSVCNNLVAITYVSWNILARKLIMMSRYRISTSLLAFIVIIITIFVIKKGTKVLTLSAHNI